MKKTKQLALCSMLTALGVVLLWTGALVEVLDLSAAALASLLIVFAMLEMGSRMAALLYAATALLALLFLPSRFPALLYAVFTGFYPILKALLERLPVWLSWIGKFVLFNGLLTLLSFLCTQVFALPDTGMELHILLYLFINPVFLLYDLALTRLISFYLFRLRRQIGIDRFWKGTHR